MNKYILIDSNIVIDIVRAGILYIEFKKKKFLIDEWSIYSLVVTGYVFFFFLKFLEIWRRPSVRRVLHWQKRSPLNANMILIAATKLNVSMGINNFLLDDLCPIFINGIIALLSLK